MCVIYSKVATLFSKEKCQIMYSSSTSLWWRYLEDLPFGYGTPKERLMRTFFDHAETEKMSRNDVTVDHRCNEWFLNKLSGQHRQWVVLRVYLALHCHACPSTQFPLPRTSSACIEPPCQGWRKENLQGHCPGAPSVIRSPHKVSRSTWWFEGISKYIWCENPAAYT